MAKNRDKFQREINRSAIAERLLCGYSQRQIAEELNLTPSTVCRDCAAIGAEWKAARIESTDTARVLESERLDLLLYKLRAGIDSGDTKAIGRAIQISALRMKLLGLEMPIQVKVDAIVQEELSGFLDGLEAILPGEEYERLLDAIVVVKERQEAASRN